VLGSDRAKRRATVAGCTAGLLVASLAVWGLNGGDDEPGPDDSAPDTSEVLQPVLASTAEPTTVVDGDGPVDLAAATSATLFDEAPVVVVAPADDVAAQARAATAAVELGVPLLLAPSVDAVPEGRTGAPSGRPARATTLTDEVARLAPRTVLAVGAPDTTWIETVDIDVAVVAVSDEVDDVASIDDLPEMRRADPLDDVLVLVDHGDDDALASAATARASGAEVVPVEGTDPRGDADAIAALADQPLPDHVVALGSDFGPAERLRGRVEVAATGVELPGGGQVLFPGRRMIALYGHPGAPVLGVLGEQPVDAAVTRAQEMAADYDDLVDEPVVPAFEIITTVASAAPGPDGQYSSASTVDDLRPWVDAAGDAGVYVVLDLQPGRNDFLTQAQLYEELLAEPHVGLALDPEWRLAPDQVHMAQIGTVGADEVNAVADWLAELTREHRLPQKLLLLHQFQLRMIGDRDQVDTRHDELAVLVHADGFGTPGQKMDTWDALRSDPLPDAWWGWKNFIDEDQPTFTPAETVAVDPTPWFVSYQ
jgi:hypothetical protein